MEGQPPSANNSRDIECANPITEVEDEENLQYFDGRQIPKLVRNEQLKERNGEDYFTPKMVSFGPYYHGLPHLRMAEAFKHEALKMLVSESGNDERFFYCSIFKVIDQIRNCYVGVSRAECDDGALAKMMLLDASLLVHILRINMMEDEKKFYYFQKKLGLNAFLIALKDMCLLENQIPLWVIMQLSELISGDKEEGPNLLHHFLRFMGPRVDRNRITRIHGEDQNQPLHMVDALYRLLVQELDNVKPVQPVKKIQWKKAFSLISRLMNREENQDRHDRQFRSVIDLKAKGIHFKPSSQCLKDIDFKSYTFYGQLQLPVSWISVDSNLLFTHLIAFELQSESSVTVISYIGFLKSIILKPEDARELIEKKILFTTYGSDEQVVQIIKEINTFGFADPLFDMRRRIEDHCSSRAKTWIAELIHTYFRNPWTSIGLLAATVLLILTFLQTYYTMNPKC